MTMRIPAIPTKYNGIQFRSRLEATWAAFFDRLGWKWEYEPFDTNGWIPDFVLLFPTRRVLVEVKPATTSDELRAAVDKIVKSQYDCYIYDTLVVGASWTTGGGAPEAGRGDSFSIGIGSSVAAKGGDGADRVGGGNPPFWCSRVWIGPNGANEGYAYANPGVPLNHFGFGCSALDFTCVTCGGKAADPRYHRSDRGGADASDGRRLRGYWAAAKNEAQWFPSVRT